MQQEFYRNRDIDVSLLSEGQRTCVHEIIYNELCTGKVLDDSRAKLVTMTLDLQRAGAQAVVLACTELPSLLIPAEDTAVRLFDTMAIHVEKTVILALEA